MRWSLHKILGTQRRANEIGRENRIHDNSQETGNLSHPWPMGALHTLALLSTFFYQGRDLNVASYYPIMERYG